MMGCNGFLHRFSEVVPQVPSVGDFDRIRRSGTGSFGIGAGAVAADDLGTGMCSQPFGDGIGCAIGENIDIGGEYPCRLELCRIGVACAARSRRYRAPRQWSWADPATLGPAATG